MLSNDGVDGYRKLPKHLDKMPIGFLATKSGSDIRILKHFFTHEEAELVILLRFGWERDLETLETIYKRVSNNSISKEELEIKLDKMGRKGLITTKRESGLK